MQKHGQPPRGKGRELAQGLGPQGFIALRQLGRRSRYLEIVPDALFLARLARARSMLRG